MRNKRRFLAAPVAVLAILVAGGCAETHEGVIKQKCLEDASDHEWCGGQNEAEKPSKPTEFSLLLEDTDDELKEVNISEATWNSVEVGEYFDGRAALD